MIQFIKHNVRDVFQIGNITIYTLADELGVTPSMVSRAFNPNAKIREDKRELILEAAKKYNFAPNKHASRLSMKTIHIGIVINAHFKLNIDKMIAGINLAHDAFKDYKIQHEITMLDSYKKTEYDYRKMLFKYADCDGIILVGFSNEKFTDIINDLYEVNPNIVQVHAVNESANCLCSSMHDEKVSSGIAAEFIYDCLRKSKRKNILLFTGDEESALHMRAKKEFAGNCDTLGMKLLESVPMMDSDEYLKKIVPDIFKKYENKIDGIYITSGVSEELCKYLEENSLDIPFVTFDVHEKIKDYLKKGVIYASIEQNMTGQMENGFKVLAEYLINGEKPQPKIYTTVNLVMKNNMHLYE